MRQGWRQRRWRARVVPLVLLARSKRAMLLCERVREGNAYRGPAACEWLGVSGST